MRSRFLLPALAVPLLMGQADWPTAAPESEGMDAVALQRTSDALAARRTKNFLILRNGKIVHEWYAADSGAGKPHYHASIVRRAVGYAGTPKPERTTANPAPASGLGWWTNADGVWPAVPRDAFAGAGAGHQVLLVVPSLNLVVVRNGGVLAEAGEPEGFWGPIERFVFNPVMAAVKDARQAPYRPSPIITGVKWAPVEQIVRSAPGSDNWPILTFERPANR